MSHCPNKEICGSCSWSHIPYDKQLTQKISDINGSFKLKELTFECSEILPSVKTDHYRNRMDFVIDYQGRVGMHQKEKWWKVIDNHTCFLADEKIEQAFEQVRTWVQSCGLPMYDRKSHEGFLRYAVIRSTTLGETMINLVTSAPKQEEEHLDRHVPQELLSSCTTIVWSINDSWNDISVGEDVRVIYGPGVINETIRETHYRISPNAFFQTNSFTAPLLLKTVEEFAGDLSQKTVLDLYCGTGFFSIALASKAKQMIGIEMVDDAITDAKRNAELNHADVQFHTAKTEDFDWAQYHADVVILDPPRSGMHDKALQDVLRILPNEIIYVSCNPKNFAREMVELQKYYSIEHMRAIDMFPQTPHVELVTKLTKKL